MRKLSLLSLFLLASAAPICAQERAKPELFAGYSYESLDSGIRSSDLSGTSISQTSLDRRFNLNGLNISVTGYTARRFGITGDFSAGFKTRTDSFGTVQARSKLTLYNLTAGPQVKFFGASRVTPFVHALFGVAHRNLEETALTSTASSITSARDDTNNFTMLLGGGLDARLSDHLDFASFRWTTTLSS